MLVDKTDDSTHRSESSQNSEPILGDDLYFKMMLIDRTAISSLMSLFGIITNIINIAVFVRQKCSDAVNISFAGVAVADLGSLACHLWVNIGAHPWLIQFVDLPYNPYEFLRFTAGHFQVCFVNISCWITAFITIQRCLCVTIPLKVKAVFTPRLTAFTVVFLFVALFFFTTSGFFFTGAVKIGISFYIHKNRSLVGAFFSKDGKDVLQVTKNLIYFIQVSSFFTIIASTGVLVVSLNRKTKWRDVATTATTGQSFTKRDQSLSKIVISLSTILIVCYLPGIFGITLSYIFPDFNLFGKEEKMYLLTWLLSYFLEAANSSVTIFVYYKMSSKYRQTFHEMFCGNKKCSMGTRNVLCEQEMFCGNKKCSVGTRKLPESKKANLS